MLEALVEILTESVSSTATTLPLFDDGAGDLLSLMIREGMVSDVDPHPAGEVGAAGQLITRIEAFPEAPMDEILDLRARLRRALIRFRAAMSEASRELEAAAWEEGFAPDVARLYRRTVASALLEIEETLEQLGARKSLTRVTSSASSARTAAMGLTAVLANELTELPEALLAAIGAPAIGIAAEELRRRRDLHAMAKANRFYFLFETERSLVAASR